MTAVLTCECLICSRSQIVIWARSNSAWHLYNSVLNSSRRVSIASNLPYWCFCSSLTASTLSADLFLQISFVILIETPPTFPQGSRSSFHLSNPRVSFSILPRPLEIVLIAWRVCLHSFLTGSFVSSRFPVQAIESDLYSLNGLVPKWLIGWKWAPIELTDSTAVIVCL